MEAVSVLINKTVDVVAHSAREMTQNKGFRVSKRLVLRHR